MKINQVFYSHIQTLGAGRLSLSVLVFGFSPYVALLIIPFKHLVTSIYLFTIYLLEAVLRLEGRSHVKG